MQIRRVAPDGIAAAILLAFLATAGLFYVNIMQALVAGLADGLHISSSQAGRVGAANTYGAALGALAGVFLAPRLPWRRCAWVLLVTLIGIDLACSGLSSPAVLIAVRFGHGLVGGLLVATAYGVMGRLRNPDRAFGVLLVVQYGLGGLGNILLPGLVPRFGVQVLFLALAAFSLAALCMLPFLDRYAVPPRARPAEAVGSTTRSPGNVLIAALAGLFLFQAANMGLGSYAIGLGREAGQTLSFSSAIVGASSWFGMLGALLVASISTRYGRRLPLLCAFVVTLAATSLFHFSSSATLFTVANFASSAVWAFVVPYLFGICAQIDRRGYLTVVAGLASKMGLASGIAAGAQVLALSNNYSQLIDAALLGLVAAAVATLLAATISDRAALT